MILLKRITLTIWLILFSCVAVAQKSAYRPSIEKVNDLIHTKLKISFDIENNKVFGEAWITLSPHFNSTNQVVLDAKGMIIHHVTVDDVKANFNYSDKEKLVIKSYKEFDKDKEYIVYIKYVAQPNKYAINTPDARGLFFIDPLEKDPYKPTQVWSTGLLKENTNAIWFPTIDAPNQKMSQEIYLTVSDKYQTLSNGKLINQTQNANNTRTDYWKQDAKHSPYMAFIGVGEYTIVNDSWKDVPINYYVDEKNKTTAKVIFGKTPKMLQFFEDTFQVKYPWDKFSQVVVDDFIGEAMANTSVVVHNLEAYQEKGTLIDENKWESIIANKIASHWFGNLVTAESWANVSLNESLSNYAVYLWFEHEYGKDYANDYLFNKTLKYYTGTNESKKLVRYNYEHRDDVFDDVTTSKGMAIIHMLRNELGDDVFFDGIKYYIEQNKFKNVEVTHLRLAFEEVSGRDLHEFFDQWFYSSSHPKLTVNTKVGSFNDAVIVEITQGLQAFQFPLEITIYESGKKPKTHKVWVDKDHSTFTFGVSSSPKLVTLNSSGGLLAEIFYYKTFSQYLYQYKHSKNVVERIEALTEIVKHQENKGAFLAVEKALKDSYFKIRIMALKNIDLSNRYSKENAIRTIRSIARNDSNTLVRAEAYLTLAKLIDPTYKNDFINALKNESYSIIESAVIGLYQLDRENSFVEINTLPEIVKDHLSHLLIGYYLEDRKEEHMNYVAKHLGYGLFFKQPDAKIKKMYDDAFIWVAQSNDRQSIANLTNSLVVLGTEYKSLGGDQLSIGFLREMVAEQKKVNNTDKEDLILIIRTGISKLIAL